jgi:hypothetical protein
VNPDHEKDWLDQALSARATVTPPPGFTATVMRAIERDTPSASAMSAFLMDEAVRLGVVLAGAGVLLVVDVNGMGAVLTRVVETPAAAVVASVALGVAWLVRRVHTETL